MFRTIVRMAARNVRANWRHSIASMLSVAAGFVALCLFDGYARNLRGTYYEGISRRLMLGDVVVEKEAAANDRDGAGWDALLDRTDQAFLDRFLEREGDRVAAHVRFLSVTGLITNGSRHSVFSGLGYDPQEGAGMRGPKWNWDATAGIPLQEAKSGAVLLGMGMGAAFDCVPGAAEDHGHRALDCQKPRMQLSASTEAGRLNAVDASPAGLIDAGFKEVDARFVAMDLATAQKLLDTERISMVTVRLAPGIDVRAFVDRLRSAAAAEHLRVTAMPWQEHRLGDTFVRALAVLQIFQIFVVAIVICVAAMSVSNSMIKTVSERTREIGSMRALGLFRRHVTALFSLEALFVSFASCALGVVVTIALSFAIAKAGIRYRAGLLAEPVPLEIAIVPATWLTGTIVLGVVAIISAFIPAHQASRMRITDALGHV